ncbi:MAG: class I SAM-dependent methyltransferase [Rubrivivax sp.]|nr:class I SAM-dependent methyltransferase [Rubrivivax sp.]
MSNALAQALPHPLPADEPAAVQGMQRYYVARAAYYERVYHRPARQADLRALEAWLAETFRGHRVLEVAAGTGWWIPQGARHAEDWLATDINGEPWAVAQAKTLPACVRFAALDAYALDSASVLDGQRFDAAFAGCWWSHVPLTRLPGFLAALHRRLQPGARVVFLDNAYVEGDSTPLSRRDVDGNTYQLRSLDDGSQHEVLKNFPESSQALQMIGASAHDAQWTAFRHYWLLSYRWGEAPPP